MLTQSLYHHFEKVGRILFYLCLTVRPSVSPSVSSSVRPMNMFVVSFSWTTFKDFRNLVSGFIEVGYIVWCVFRFITQQLSVYRTLFTCVESLKFSSYFSQKLQYNDFWNLVSRFIQVSYTVWCFFQIHNSITSCLPKYLGGVSSVARTITGWSSFICSLYIDPVIWKMKYSFLFYSI